MRNTNGQVTGQEQQKNSVPPKTEVDSIRSDIVSPSTFVSNSTAPSNLKEFENFCDRLRAVDIHIREQQWNSPRTVLFFTDLHKVESAGLVYQKLSYCGGLVNFDLIGLEGWIDSPDSASYLRVRETVTRVANVELVAKPTVSPTGEVTGITNSVQVYWSFFDPSFSQVPGMQNVNVIGIESNVDSLTKGKITAAALNHLNGLIAELAAGHKMIIQRSGVLAPYFSGLVQSLDYLEDFQDVLPKLSIDNFPPDLQAGVVLVEPKHRQFFESIVPRLNRLLAETNGSRNAECVDKLNSLTSGSGSSMSALVFGVAHSVDHPQIAGHPIQHYLSERGMSYVVLDEYSNAVELVNEAIAHQM